MSNFPDFNFKIDFKNIGNLAVPLYEWLECNEAYPVWPVDAHKYNYIKQINVINKATSYDEEYSPSVDGEFLPTLTVEMDEDMNLQWYLSPESQEIHYLNERITELEESLKTVLGVLR